MARPLMISIQDATVRLGNETIFEDLTFHIHAGDKIALVGKNGAGKSTLMRVITGEQHLLDGERWQEFGLTIGYLAQEVTFNPQDTVFDYTFQGVEADDEEEGDQSYKVEMILEPLELDPNVRMSTLSGGQLRRTALARALVEAPDVLLLDEPTNHLDLHVIEWLENYLNGYRGTVLCVSHDRTFLGNITNRIFWLDRGKLRSAPKGFKHFEEWSSDLLDQEAREIHNRERKLAMELEWASRGVKARRKRNVARLEKMRDERKKLKADKSSYRQMMRTIDLEPDRVAPDSARIVGEFYNVSKKFDDKDGTKTILDNFNLRIMRGDRIGVLGRNGTGKSTFLRMVIGEEQPDSGTIKLNKNISWAYFDQKRRDLDPNKTLWETLCPNGGDHVKVLGKMKHVCGYLRDFLFDPGRAREKVKLFSGGQKNRLMLAKVLADPGDLLILDEPTNDLDMETLDILEEILSHYKGTLFVVSHDRDFLDQTVSKVLAFEGEGKVEGYIGGYSDYLEKVREQKGSKQKEKHKELKEQEDVQQSKKEEKLKKLTYKLQQEQEQLAEVISELEAEIEKLKKILSQPDLYASDPDLFQKASELLGKKQAKLDSSEERWLEIEGFRETE